ncbi:hypothetical protein Pcinc_017686 [Petrolisthes cinctipes]|uniref:Ionotropic glutamate receptor C-terminal domain-containing protein n=1 Tax=Petrolisthes cinctipes TaxID=88211 RepID=A0AAE1FTP6_PETCI|nr:hypothetical protein Pcinc_017686 [Petrolisthes cinctipes]
MLGQVVRGEKDFVINGMALVRDRYLATDFTITYFSDSYSITLQIPPPSPLWLSVVYPFGVWVWASLGACLVLLSLAFHALVKPDPIRIYNTGADVISTLVWLSKTLLRQASPSVPSAPGCRPFLALWYLAALVLSTSYMGNLIAFLTVPAQTKRIDTLQELARTNLRLHMLDYGNFVPGYLWSSKEPVLRQLGAKLSLLSDYNEVIAAFDRGAGVLEASEYSHFLFITRRRQKRSYRVEEKLYPNYVGWVFRKGSPYTYLFNRYLSWMSESGLVGHWRRSVLDDFQRSVAGGDGELTKAPLEGEAEGEREKEEEEEVGRASLQPLNLEHLQGAFIVLGLGNVLALVVLVAEALKAVVRVRG